MPQNLKTIRKIHYEKTDSKWLLMLRGKNPSPHKRGSHSWPTSAQVKATWESKFLLANYILPLSNLIKPLFHLSLVNFNLTTWSSIHRPIFFNNNNKLLTYKENIITMVPISATRWFIHTKTLKFDEVL
jgi:hypothetical protein